jgi:RND family efflux transporter MFP subunit
MSIALPDRTSVRTILPWMAAGLALAFLVMSQWMHDAFFHHGGPEGASTSPAEAEPKADTSGPGGLPGSVTLLEGKFQTAGITLAPTWLESLPAELGVPGRIDVNQDRQVQVRPRASGVIREVKVSIGQIVKKGQTLAVLDSSDIGLARLNLRSRQRELVVARVKAEYDRQVAANVSELIPELRKSTEAAVLEKKYAERQLGPYRATLGEAYSRYDIASHEEKKMAGLFQKEIVGEHQPFVTKHTREGTQAVFEGALETARFEATQQSLVSSQKVRDAEAAVVDAAQRLRILGVTENISDLLNHADKASLEQLATEDVTAYTITAPFGGVIIQKSSLAVPSQKAEVNDVLFTLADLSTVWVMANVPESDFALLPSLQSGKIRLSAAAYPGRSFEAKLLSVGATVDPATRTVPMLAATPNPDGLLKIGMFVRISFDTALETKALTVPASAVVEIEGKKGVFVPEGAHDEKAGSEQKAGHTFAFRAVKLGREAGDRQVIESGLPVGATVVSQGAFTLKSELILQNETEEE